MDILLAVLVFLPSAAMAYMGVHVTLHPPQADEERSKYKKLFIGMTVASVILIGAQTYRTEHSTDQLEGQMRNISGQLTTERIENSSNMAYLKGRLDQSATESQIGALAKQIVSSNAQVIAEETQRITSEDLSKQAIEWVMEMRNFEQQAHAREMQILSEPVPNNRDEQAFLRRNDQITNVFYSEENEFRQKYLGRAIYLRDSLLDRLGAKAPTLAPAESAKMIAFDGAIAGPTPIADAADYLERLARILTPKLP